MTLVNTKRLWIAAAIIAAIIVVGFVLSVPHTHDAAKAPAPLAPAQSAPAVTLHDVYKKGTHTISGTLNAADACTSASGTAALEGSASSSQSILVSISAPVDSGICLDIPTPVKFSTTIVAPANLPLSATVNGVLASTTAS